MNLRKDHYRIRSLNREQFEKKPRALLPRVFGSSASDFDVRWVRSGRQVCLIGPWTASWRVLLKVKALRPFQEVNCFSPLAYNSLDCTDLEISVEPAVMQNCVPLLHS